MKGRWLMLAIFWHTLAHAGPCVWPADMADHPLMNHSEKAAALLDACIRKAEGGDGFAKHHMGVVWMFGMEPSAGFGRGVRGIAEAARAGYDASGYGPAYFDFPFRGADGRLLPARARIRDWRRQAGRGKAEAQDMLGRLHLAGLGVERDFTRAFAWIRKAAAQGYPEGEYHLAWLYLAGVGAARDDARGAHWMARAARHGVVAAWDALGGLYAAGRGVKRNDAAAARWYRRAALRGHAGGQYHLGLMLWDGRGATRDAVAAYGWLALAASMGHRQARAARDALAGTLTPEQLKRARAWVAAWEPERMEPP